MCRYISTNATIFRSVNATQNTLKTFKETQNLTVQKGREKQTPKKLSGTRLSGNQVTENSQSFLSATKIKHVSSSVPEFFLLVPLQKKIKSSSLPNNLFKIHHKPNPCVIQYISESHVSAESQLNNVHGKSMISSHHNAIQQNAPSPNKKKGTSQKKKKR